MNPVIVTAILLSCMIPASLQLNHASYAGFKFVEGQVNGKNSGSFSEALKACADVNGYLPSVHSEVDRTLLVKHYYAKDVKAEDSKTWLGAVKVGGKWSWLDGSAVDYTGNNTDWDKCECDDCLLRFSREGIASCDDCTGDCDKENKIICLVPLPNYPFFDKGTNNHPLLPYAGKDSKGKSSNVKQSVSFS